MRRAFRWTRALGAVALEPLAGDDATDPLHLSPDGATVLAQSSSAAGSRLFVWTEATGTRAIENLPGYTNCHAVPTVRLSYGFASGGSCSSEEGGYEAFVWAGQESLVAIGRLEMWTPAGPAAVTSDGAVAVGVGSAGDVTSGTRPYRWTETAGLELIELPEGYTRGAPAADRATMSEDGAIVVGAMDGIARRGFLWSESTGTVVLSPLEGHNTSVVFMVSRDGSVAVGTSLITFGLDTIEDLTAVYWHSDGVVHRIADELGAAGLDLGGGALELAQYVEAPLGFVGYGRKDDVSNMLGWRARLP